MEKETFSRREFFYLSGVALSSATVLAACGGSNSASSNTVTFWNSTYQTSDSTDKTKKKEDFYIYQAIARFEKANPGLKVNMQVVPGTPEMFIKYRVASVAKNGPDVMTLWSGNYMLQFQRYLEPLNEHFSQAERDRLRGWAAVTDGFKEGSGKIYGVPNASDGIVALLYNKKFLAQAGVDIEKEGRQSFEAFLTVLSKIKAAGTTPLAMYDNGYTFFSLDYWIAQLVDGSPGIDELVSGKRNFSDPALVELATKWAKMAQYSVPGAPTMDNGQAMQYFTQRKVALIVSLPGNIEDARKALKDDLGMCFLPNYDENVSIRDTGIGGTGAALIVSNYSKNKENALKLVKFLTSKEEETIQAQVNPATLINATDVDVSKIYTDPLKIQQQQWVLDPKAIFWPDNVFPAELTSELAAQAQLVWTGKMTAVQFMKLLDGKRDALLAASR
jgi:raffinose/stachyose/melibiose transport system substrate-binding protein